MLQLSPETNVIVYFEGVTKGMSPVIRQIILEDVKSLLEGRSGEFLEHRRDIGDQFLEICGIYGLHLSFPLRR